MNETLSTSCARFPEVELVPASGHWEGRGYAFRSHVRALIRDPAIAIVLAISPLSFGSDALFMNRRSYFAVTQSVTLQPIRKRRVSFLEARNIALHILRTAEAERSRQADDDAHRGIDWENGA